ncbi:helix-hairpin-helix domain-containing protein [Maribellus sediminis]|uniref:helix-hairpin-helix domain-containing protein n=1 Tax=Maribellus sediminis TaxID=2696285 RepID=UPI0014320E75|nr:helix-hairpin-helix domain-containing protein [Maribellus sediminis]
MLNLWRKIQRQFLTYSRSDRNAVLILAAILLLLIFANRILPAFRTERSHDFSKLEGIIEDWEKKQALENAKPELELFNFDPNVITRDQIEILDLPYFVKQNILSYRESGGKFTSTCDLRKIYGMNDSIFNAIKDYIQIERTQAESSPVKTKVELEMTGTPFDPNKVSADSLLKYGFTEFQSSNLIKYRDNGGVFTLPQDLLKIYGIDSVFYVRIEDYIRIESPNKEVKEIVRIELNGADTSDLMKLPGIGPAYASRIIRYRELLGGYYTVEQLLEVYGFPQEVYDRVSNQVFTDTVKLNKLRINFLEYPELIRHPYLNKEQVTELLNHRDASGAYKKLEDIKFLESFDSENFKRIRPYITCR